MMDEGMTRNLATEAPSVGGILDRQPLRIVITGGGTGGHVSPAVAVLEELRSRGPLDALWVGSQQGYEAHAAREHGVPYRAVHVGKLRRYASLSTLADSVRVPVGVVEAWRILRQFRPDVVFSTGGFVGVPAVIAAHRLGVPSLTHEQTAHLGLATRINSRFCDVVALTYSSTAAALRARRPRVIVTGNPVRSQVLHGRDCAALERFGLSPERPLLYVTGGIQGAHAINTAVLGALGELLQATNVIHQCGADGANGDYTRLVAASEALPDPLRCRYRVVEVVGTEIGDIYAAASLVVGRAGAGTVAELSAVGLPSILIPLPGAVEQRLNAAHLVAAGAARLVSQDALTSATLALNVAELIGNRDKLTAMRQAALSSAPLDAARRVADALVELACA
jgi:UDP-N-acetylglucosamine--N-acetylmuramyl-(pentapeptide) pyrophosphoryl-undecaprenol N-acetylglucosamine transferase